MSKTGSKTVHTERECTQRSKNGSSGMGRRTDSDREKGVKPHTEEREREESTRVLGGGQQQPHHLSPFLPPIPSPSLPPLLPPRVLCRLLSQYTTMFGKCWQAGWQRGSGGNCGGGGCSRAIVLCCCGQWNESAIGCLDANECPGVAAVTTSNRCAKNEGNNKLR